MSDLDPDEKENLQELQCFAKQARAANSVPEDKLKKMKEILELDNERKVRGLKPTTLARAHDVTNTVKYLKNEVGTYILICYWALTMNAAADEFRCSLPDGVSLRDSSDVNRP